MCGIAGIIPFGGDVNLSRIDGMIESILHRGPDQKNIFKSKDSVFGFVRLKIIDLSDNANQPFVSEDKKIKIIYNGEIYNFIDLKRTYLKQVKFKSNGDGEVILHLYQKFGIDFVSKINGMFSIAIIDERSNKTFLIRDRFGIKPLYYYIDKNKLIFCSEIQGIKKALNKNLEINKNEAFKFFKQGLINSGKETWFKNIFQVKQSCFLEINGKKILEKKYYNIQNNIDEQIDTKNLSFKYYVSEFKERILNSFEKHNIYDVPAGVHLSGGIDSAVLAALSNYFKKDYKTFTFDFNDKKFSELEYAQTISKSVNLKNFSTVLNEKNLHTYLLKVLEREYEPFSSLRILSQHNLYDYYKNDCKVILDGSGGDEIGAGYSYYLIPWYLDLLKGTDKEKLKKRFFKNLQKIKNDTITENQFIHGSFAQYKNPGSSTIDGSFYKMDDLFSKDFNNINSYQLIKKPFKSHLRNAQFADLFYLKLPRSLKYADRGSMYNSIETRVPFLDHKVVEWSLQIPSKFKLLDSQQRITMKYPFKKYVDKKTLYQNKRTIADPQSFWLKNHLKSMLQDLINSSDFDNYQLFNKSEVKNYFKNFLEYPKHFNSFLLFQILIFELWTKNVLNKY